MNRTQLDAYRRWFGEYVARFERSSPGDLPKTELKERHTYRVCDEIRALCESEGIGAEDALLAETAALFHDVGRFAQYIEHRGISDRHAEDHAKLGIDLLRREKVLADLDDETRELVFRVISYHNRALPPADETERCLLLTKLVRDADKLDILDLVTRHYEDPDPAVQDLITLGLPDTSGVSAEVIADLVSGSTVRAEHLRTFNDLKLLQMGWVNDIHFRRTFEQFQERRYLEKIVAHLPRTPEVRDVYDMLSSRVHSTVEAA